MALDRNYVDTLILAELPQVRADEVVVDCVDVLNCVGGSPAAMKRSTWPADAGLTSAAIMRSSGSSAAGRESQSHGLLRTLDVDLDEAHTPKVAAHDVAQRRPVDAIPGLPTTIRLEPELWTSPGSIATLHTVAVAATLRGTTLWQPSGSRFSVRAANVIDPLRPRSPCRNCRRNGRRAK